MFYNVKTNVQSFIQSPSSMKSYISLHFLIRNYLILSRRELNLASITALSQRSWAKINDVIVIRSYHFKKRLKFSVIKSLGSHQIDHNNMLQYIFQIHNLRAYMLLMNNATTWNQFMWTKVFVSYQDGEASGACLSLSIDGGSSHILLI